MSVATLDHTNTFALFEKIVSSTECKADKISSHTNLNNRNAHPLTICGAVR